MVCGIGMAAGLGGCGTDSFAPPPPEGLRTVIARAPQQGATTKVATGARPVEIILAPRDPDAAVSSAHFARTQAGFDGVMVHPVAPPMETTPAGQADLVEAAIKEKPPVLIVEPAESPDPRLPKLIEQARDGGVPVVIVGPPPAGIVPSKEGADSRKAPLVLIESVSFAPTAKQLVHSAIRVARTAQIDPKGGVILYYGTTGDPYIAARLSAVRAALDEEGITAQFPVISPPGSGEGLAALKAAIAKETKATMVFPFDHRTYMDVNTAVTELPETRTVVVAGYTSEEKSPFIPQIPNMAASAEFRPAKMIRKAVQVAHSLIRGDKVISPIEISINFIDSPPSMGIPSIKRVKKKSDLDVDKNESSDGPKP